MDLVSAEMSKREIDSKGRSLRVAIPVRLEHHDMSRWRYGSRNLAIAGAFWGIQ
jgi:hypothetical protein